MIKKVINALKFLGEVYLTTFAIVLGVLTITIIIEHVIGVLEMVIK